MVGENPGVTSLRRTALAALLACSLTWMTGGCKSLEYRDDDSIPETVGKTIVILPGVVGVALYEGFAADVRFRQERIEFNEETGLGETDYYREIY